MYFSLMFYRATEAKCHLFEVKAVRDVIGGHERGQQMSDRTGLTTVRSEREGVHPPLSVEHRINVHLGEQLEGKRDETKVPKARQGGPTCGAG